MASVYTNHLRLEEIGSGEQSGTWGDTTNTNLELIAEAFGYGTEAITTNQDTHTTTIANGASSEGRHMYLKYTGALDSDCTITLTNTAGDFTVSKVWIIENATTDSGSSGPYNIVLTSGSGADITIPNGHVKVIYTDGAGSGGAVVDAFTDLNLAGTTTTAALTVSGATTQTGVSTSAGKDVFNAGMSVKNGSTSAGFVEFFEDSDNGTNKATLIGPASTADITLTLPSMAGTIATTTNVTDEATALAIALG